MKSIESTLKFESTPLTIIKIKSGMRSKFFWIQAAIGSGDLGKDAPRIQAGQYTAFSLLEDGACDVRGNEFDFLTDGCNTSRTTATRLLMFLAPYMERQYIAFYYNNKPHIYYADGKGSVFKTKLLCQPTRRYPQNKFSVGLSRLSLKDIQDVIKAGEVL